MMRARLSVLLALLLAVVGCSRAPLPRPPTRTPSAIAASPFVASTLPPSSVPATTDAPATTAVAASPTSVASPTPAPAVATLASDPTAEAAVQALGDPLLRAYRAMISIQVNAALLSETAGQVQSGALEQEDVAVAGLAIGSLTQSVAESLPGLTPPPALATAWPAMLADHEQVKSIGARWVLGDLGPAQTAAAVAPLLLDMEQNMLAADQAVAAAYNVKAASLTEYRLRVVHAVGGLFQ